MPRHVLTLDLKDDPALIAAYDEHHRAVWPEIETSILTSGIRAMTIHRLHTRLVMILDVDDDFSFARKAAADVADPVVQRWETLMERFQDVRGDGGKWREMIGIYALEG